VTGAGTRALAVDMTGHACAPPPAAVAGRPFDAGLLVPELSPVACHSPG
jgi:hypothetical protein